MVRVGTPLADAFRTRSRVRRRHRRDRFGYARRNRRATRARRGAPSRGAAFVAGLRRHPLPQSRPSRDAPALTSQVSESMAQKRNRPLEITPLSIPLSLSDSPLTKLSARQPSDRPRTPDVALSMTAESVRTMLTNATRLREIASLSESCSRPWPCASTAGRSEAQGIARSPIQISRPAAAAGAILFFGAFAGAILVNADGLAANTSLITT